MNSFSILRRAVVVAISAGVMLTATMFAASPASAISVTNSGSPGTVYTQKTLGTYWMGEVTLNSGQVTAYRSPAYAGDQRITIRWRVWRMLAGTWVKDGDASTTYIAKPGQYVSHPAYTGRELSNYYSTDFTITWQTSTGAFLGSKFLDYVHSTDYQCGTTFCAVIWAGGQYSLAMY